MQKDLIHHRDICNCCWLCAKTAFCMLLVIKNLSYFLIYCFYICSDIMSSESLITYEEWSTCLFLTFITCYIDSLTSRLLVIVKMFIELNEFVELMRFIKLKKFRKKEENEQLSFNASEYLINLFQKISSDYFICSFHLRHEHLQNSWLSLQFTHHLLFIDTMHSSMWCLSAHLKQHSSFLQNLTTWSKSKHL